MPRFDLVIFDCDGVLVDSEAISTRILTETLNAHGLRVDLQHVTGTYLGCSFATVREDFFRHTGAEAPAELEARFHERLFQAYGTELRAMAGATELLAGLGVPTCVATSSSPERADRSLALTGLLPYFQGRVFSAAMVARGKPEPDLFLHAAQNMGVRPERALVIEDSEPGLLAAQRAGMSVWRFVGGSHFDSRVPSPAENAAEVPVFQSMASLAAALREAEACQ